MKKDLTTGNVTKTMLLFAGPMILGNLLQQCYNIVDMLIVGRALGAGALAAVGSAYSLMTFLTSVLIGMCMGSGSLFSYSIGKRDTARLQYEMTASFSFIGIVTIVMNIVVFVCMKPILNILQIPEDIYGMMQEYVWYIFWGIFFVFLYNYFSFLLRAAGFGGVTGIPGNFFGTEYCAGSCTGVWNPYGNQRRGDRDSHIPDCIRDWNLYLYMDENAGITFFPAARKNKGKPKCNGRSGALFGCVKYPAVSDEFWNPDDTGSGQQLWNRSHGGIRSGCED